MAANGVALAILKRSTRDRLAGEGAAWLQPARSPNPAIVNRVDFILDFCTNKKVLHIGFTDHPFTGERIASGALLHMRLKSITADLVGIDIEPGSISRYIALTNDEKAYQADITEQYPYNAIAFQPEVILLSEVLEHLANPYKAIEVLYQALMRPTGWHCPKLHFNGRIAASVNRRAIHPEPSGFCTLTLCRFWR